MKFASYEPPPPREQGDAFKARDNVGKALIVKVIKTGFHEQTSQGRGGEAIYLDLVDLTDGKVYRDVMWMAGALVDSLKRYAGGAPVVISLEMTPNKNQTREYLNAVPATEEQIAKANAFVKAHGDPFVKELATVGSESASATPPF